MAKTTSISIPEIQTELIEIVLVGDTPYISHRFSEKAKKMIEDKQQGKARSGRANRDPQAEYEASRYPHPDGGFAIPGRSFKAAVVDAAADVGIYKTTTKRALYVVEDLVQIQRAESRMREDRVVIARGTTDIRYRAEFPDWWVKITVHYNSGTLNAEQVINLFEHAGFGCGVGEWRPNAPKASGNFGRFHVARGEEAQRLLNEINENGKA